MHESDSITALPRPDGETIYRLLSQLGMTLEIPVQRSKFVTSEDSESEQSLDPLHSFLANAEQFGIFAKEVRFESVEEAIEFVAEGYPVVVAFADLSFAVVERLTGRKLETVLINEHVSTERISRGKLQRWLVVDQGTRIFVVKKELECEALSSTSGHQHDESHHVHASPLKRFIGLLYLERRDILTVALFGFVSGLLTLATPLAVESLVNVVSWGTYLQPLIVLGAILLACLGIAGLLRILQTVAVELIQRRQFVRIVSDLAHRFPRAHQPALIDEYPRELANRVFDIMTIQKATSMLLLDGLSIALTTLLGLLLLGFYHPYLLGFDIVLIITMIGMTWILGRSGIRTAIDESRTKYRVAHWLQDVIASPSAFKTGGGESLAIERANQLTAEYIYARRRQFRVVIRQTSFAIGLQVIASTAVLAMGGWLVIDGQLTLGQLVASELVVTAVVGAFAKAGKSLEKFYDLMAGIDKVGHLVDIPTDPRTEIGSLNSGPIAVRWNDLVFERASSSSRIRSTVIEAGSKVALVGDDVDGRSDLARSIAGLCKPTSGLIQIDQFDCSEASAARDNRLVGYAGDLEIFNGSLLDNIGLGRPDINQNHVREVLNQVCLTEEILKLPNGLQTHLQTGGFPLSTSQQIKLLIARAIVVRPKVVVIDGLLDRLSTDVQSRILDALIDKNKPWTLIVGTNVQAIADRCETQIFVRQT
ncbi:ATP-binding cassette domain-containing protein [Rubripirellula amarantea]|uniref:Lactococcin-G-processing and transport ATP-binding protein LagD n=1 Tax=Rubripirellula amarantea TaxID=2527999 RepID=A0A5C5WFQ1_9BACT|nr:ATP-binding cassette domain-containing protein [Rubripirellula amarantea]MDA8743297.1 ATP-binding cassette domain-containing protein [Rubripirellula amarantea]TWT49584.1 Lactococcin-G-processing and transport ATP-binding protein LagD [Rubripirellula amarantea]